jgi:hypothetical protein
MISLLYGIAALILFWWLARVYARMSPATLARVIKGVGGAALLGLAVLMLFRGRIDMALLIGGFAAWLLGWSAGLRGLPGWGRGQAIPSGGKTSRVRSALVEMELDHDTGEMRGTVLGGAFESRSLDSLSERELQALHEECVGGDPEGARLLEAYFDRRFPGWRKHADGDADAGAGGEAQPGAMTEEEAYQILGLEPGATVEAVKRAHRALMMKLHPDQGGSTYLASRVNQAKDILLSRHR